MNDDATPPPPMPPPDRPQRAGPPPPRPAVHPAGAVMIQPASGASPQSAPRPPSAPKQPFADPARGVSADPQVSVDTREIALAELREAARRAQGATTPAHPETEAHVDLVAAEQHEAAELDSTRELVDGVDAELAPDGSSLIDPRIRERRVAVTRAEGRRRLRILLTAISIASAIGILWLVVQSPLLAVKTIHVEGTARESRAAVEAAAGVRTGSALLFVDTSEVARRVEALPWVARATVRRELPNGLEIRVLERSPVAWARRPVPLGSPEGTLGAIVLVDRSGRVLGDEPVPPAGLPELIGMVLVPERGERIAPAAPAAAVARLPDALRAQTGSVVRRRGQAVLQLVQPPGGAEPAAGEVRLGNLEDIAAKGAAALAVLDQLAAGGEHVRYVDVRVPGAPATR